mgnify:CR=1 FL=1
MDRLNLSVDFLPLRFLILPLTAVRPILSAMALDTARLPPAKTGYGLRLKYTIDHWHSPIEPRRLFGRIMLASSVGRSTNTLVPSGLIPHELLTHIRPHASRGNDLYNHIC